MKLSIKLLTGLAWFCFGVLMLLITVYIVGVTVLILWHEGFVNYR